MGGIKVIKAIKSSVKIRDPRRAINLPSNGPKTIPDPVSIRGSLS